MTSSISVDIKWAAADSWLSLLHDLQSFSLKGTCSTGLSLAHFVEFFYFKEFKLQHGSSGTFYDLYPDIQLLI